MSGPENAYDVIVIGAGPVGYTLRAAVAPLPAAR
jgi:pyruvate/2-oxoglutarate dehydrogenase complex dihydrolipoamide dehydrogenase (E3) component